MFEKGSVLLDCSPVSSEELVAINDDNVEHGFAASKATDHDVVGDETENNSANSQTLVVENQHINSPKETELMANADYDAPKKPASVVFFYFKPLPKATQCEKKRKRKKSELKHCYKHTHQRNVRIKRKAEGEKQETLKKQRREAHESKKGVKKLKLSSCRPKSLKSKPNSPVASTSKDVVIRCPTCEDEYCDPTTEEWI
ncbi:uncharacterized protein TNCV_2439121 [Trichonephila clavipes]|nr:uncharacterized protein TNCV_2439121 [Trichonephila clavipes]